MHRIASDGGRGRDGGDVKEKRRRRETKKRRKKEEKGEVESR